MSDLNLCVFTGRFGQDPEAKYTPSGTAVCNFSLAVGRQYKDKNGKKVEETQWVDFVAFGRMAEIICEYMGKGSQCQVTGRWQKRKWETKEGQTRYSVEVVVEDFQMLGGKSAKQDLDNDHQPEAEPQTRDFDDDIPF